MRALEKYESDDLSRMNETNVSMHVVARSCIDLAATVSCNLFGYIGCVIDAM